MNKRIRHLSAATYMNEMSEETEMGKLEDTTPKLLNSITEHPDVQRLIIQLVELKNDFETIETLYNALKPVNRHLQAENKRLKEAIAYAEKCFEKIGHDGNIIQIEKIIEGKSHYKQTLKRNR